MHLPSGLQGAVGQRECSHVGSVILRVVSHWPEGAVSRMVHESSAMAVTSPSVALFCGRICVLMACLCVYTYNFVRVYQYCPRRRGAAKNCTVLWVGCACFKQAITADRPLSERLHNLVCVLLVYAVNPSVQAGLQAGWRLPLSDCTAVPLVRASVFKCLLCGDTTTASGRAVGPSAGNLMCTMPSCYCKK